MNFEKFPLLPKRRSLENKGDKKKLDTAIFTLVLK
jgi:hypothetical protein